MQDGKREFGQGWDLTNALGTLIPRKNGSDPARIGDPVRQPKKREIIQTDVKTHKQHVWTRLQSWVRIWGAKNPVSTKCCIKNRCHLNIGLCLFSTDPVGEDILDYSIWKCSRSSNVTSPGNTTLVLPFVLFTLSRPLNLTLPFFFANEKVQKL